MTGHEEEFQYWLAHMDDALDEFFAQLPGAVRVRLDYSVESLDVLEAWLLDRYPGVEATRPKSESRVLDGAARYIGETFRKVLGGGWWVDPKGEIMGGLPHVTFWRSSEGADTPLTMATASTSRRRGNYISGILRRQIAFLTTGVPRSPLLDDRRFRKHVEKTTEEERFEYWLELMDRGLDELRAELPDDVRDQLDFSPDSLGRLESWLLERWPTGAHARDGSQALTVDGVARYVGETLRKTLGATWWFDLEGWSHDGLPQVTLGDGFRLCPVALAFAAADLRTGEVFTEAWRRARDQAPDAPA